MDLWTELLNSSKRGLSVQPAKKIVSIGILLLVIAGAVYYGVTKFGRPSAKPPKWVLARPLELIDCESLELITRSRGEWQALGQKDGKFKNPATGAYTMVVPIICASCGKKIPPAEMPEALKARPEDSSEEALAALADERRKIRTKYRCPRCGGLANPRGM